VARQTRCDARSHEPDVFQLARLSADGVTASHVLAVVAAVGNMTETSQDTSPTPRPSGSPWPEGGCGLAQSIVRPPPHSFGRVRLRRWAIT